MHAGMRWFDRYASPIPTVPYARAIAPTEYRSLDVNNQLIRCWSRKPAPSRAVIAVPSIASAIASPQSLSSRVHPFFQNSDFWEILQIRGSRKMKMLVVCCISRFQDFVVFQDFSLKVGFACCWTQRHENRCYGLTAGRHNLSIGVG